MITDDSYYDSDNEEIGIDNGKWVTLKDHTDYEIFDQFPFPIRKKGSNKPISESIAVDSGYIQCTLNQRNYKKHRLIALQFIPNPNDLKCVDHINHNRSDNRLENLRWVSHIYNNCNRRNQRFLQDIDKNNATEVKNFNSWQFEDLWFIDDQFVRFNGINYTILNKYYDKRYDIYQTKVSDINGRPRTISFTKFKREFNLLK